MALGQATLVPDSQSLAQPFVQVDHPTSSHTDRSRATWLVLGGASLLGLYALALYAHANLLLIQRDAVAHLDTARSVFDSLTPSFAQLGGVWLPLPHLLMLPTIWLDPLWRSGLSGSIVSFVAYVCAAIYVQRIAFMLTRSTAAGLITAGIFATNPNMLYMQATPMTESLAVFLILAATYHLLRFCMTNSLLHLGLSSIWVAAATLTRYELWALVPVAGSIIIIVSLIRTRNLRYTEATLAFWSFIAVYGVVLWLLYNRAIFGDALNFEHGPGSALSFTANAARAGLLPTKGNLLFSLKTYTWTSIDNIGIPLTIVGYLGLGALLCSRLSLGVKACILLPASIFAFSVASLYRGESLIYTPNLPPYSFYNDRYGLLMLPAVVVSASMVARAWRLPGIVLLVFVLIPQVVTLPALAHTSRAEATALHDRLAPQLAHNWVGDNLPLLNAGQAITLFEPEFDEATAGGNTFAAASWFRSQTPTGHVLISEQANGQLVYYTGLALHRFVYEGTKPLFEQALADPGRYCDWIIYRPHDSRDLLGPLMHGATPAGYVLEFDNGDYQIFHRVA